MNRSRHSWFLLLALTATLGAGLPATGQKSQPQADVLLESAKQKELVEGKLEEAIKLYQRIVQDYAANRPVAAKALLRMGQCYERLGLAEARKTYERLVREFGDQTDTVAEARARLAALAAPARPPKTGLAVHQVWAGWDADLTGSVSADGRFLATTDWSSGDIAIRDVATGEMRRVTKTGDVNQAIVFGFHATFSRDAKQIAYAWYNPKNQQFDLWLVGADGTGARLLYEEKAGYIFPADWTPDGKSIVALVGMTKGDKSSRMVLVSAESGAVRVLKSSSQGDPTRISASPDGRFLVYDVPQADGKRDICLMLTESGRETRLVEHPADDKGPIWTPDGQRVLFISDRTGSAGLWAQEVIDGEALAPPELVKQDMGRISPMGFTKHGALYYGLSTDVSEVFVATLDLKTGRLLDKPSPISQQIVAARTLASWSPDGKHLAYLSKREPAPPGSTITIRTIDSGEERDIHVDMSPIRRLVWAPDGTALIFPGLDRDRRSGVFRVDLKSGTVSTLVHASPGVVIPQAGVTRDGKTLVYLAVSVTSGPQPVVVRDLQTGQEKTITEPAPIPTGMALSPDGQQVAITTADEASGRQALVVMPVAGGAAREIYGVDKPRSILRFPFWTSDGSRILCVVRLQDKTENLLVPVDPGEPVKVSAPMTGVTDLSFHPDGRRVAFAAGQSRSELWVMENFLAPLKR